MRTDAKKNYDQILGVARDLLATGGADASLRDVARTAGVGLGTMYRHFPTREALLEASASHQLRPTRRQSGRA